jgi:hypothetical protein
MQLSDLKLSYIFSKENIFYNFHDFVSKNGHHTMNDFDNNALFRIADRNDDALYINENNIWLPFGLENQPFTIEGFEGEYILKFVCNGNFLSKVCDIVNKYWREHEQVDCSIFAVQSAIEENKSSDPFNWRPKRIEIQNYRY